MLTRRGWLVAAAATLVGAVGRVLAMPELFVLSAGGVALVIAAQVSVRVRRPRYEAWRTLHPAKVHAGATSRVELGLRNTGRLRSPVVMVRDPFDDRRRQARFLVAALGPGEGSRAAYRLPTERRGIFSIGPLELERADAFGLAARVTTLIGRASLTVYPRIDQIVPLPRTRGDDAHAGVNHPTALGASGEDFYALRAYEMGDDLRRVHWPSTARLDELMIRQLEMPWQGRATVLLDVRRPAHSAESFEMAVSAAASIVSASWRRGSLVRLVSTAGLDSGFAAGPQHVEAIMEKLASIVAAGEGTLEGVVAALRRGGNAGALVVVLSAEATAADIEQVARAQRFGSLTVVRFERSSYGGGGTTASEGAAPGAATLVRVTDRRPFADAWNSAFARAGAAPRRVRGRSG